VLDGVVSFLGMGSRSKTAISEDEASELAVEEVDIPVKTTNKKTSKAVEEPNEQSNEDKEAANDEADPEEEEEETGEGEYVNTLQNGAFRD
jgi:hypothetical protein